MTGPGFGLRFGYIGPCQCPATYAILVGLLLARLTQICARHQNCHPFRDIVIRETAINANRKQVRLSPPPSAKDTLQTPLA